MCWPGWWERGLGVERVMRRREVEGMGVRVAVEVWEEKLRCRMRRMYTRLVSRTKMRMWETW